MLLWITRRNLLPSLLFQFSSSHNSNCNSNWPKRDETEQEEDETWNVMETNGLSCIDEICSCSCSCERRSRWAQFANGIPQQQQQLAVSAWDDWCNSLSWDETSEKNMNLVASSNFSSQTMRTCFFSWARLGPLWATLSHRKSTLLLLLLQAPFWIWIWIALWIWIRIWMSFPDDDEYNKKFANSFFFSLVSIAWFRVWALKASCCGCLLKLI